MLMGLLQIVPQGLWIYEHNGVPSNFLHYCCLELLLNSIFANNQTMKFWAYWERVQDMFGKNSIFFFTIKPKIYLVEVRVCEWSWNQLQKSDHGIFIIITFLGHFIVHTVKVLEISGDRSKWFRRKIHYQI